MNGTNTIGNNQIPNGSEDRPYYELNLQGGGSKGGGFVNGRSSVADGGYGGCGGNDFGGGGGYGGNGGNNSGGGGYGANGGDGYFKIFDAYIGGTSRGLKVFSGGGGGGYGPSGTGGSRATGFIDGGIAAGGAGGVIEANINIPAGRGGNGICIIQYYA